MTRRSTSRRRESEGGYALLMVFLMAAIIAIMLYQQLPRVAFESEREKEQLLIDRGEQYTRAIQLYYLANNRQYPTSLDDLEKQEKRFLRRRFVDPFSGKADWRIVHTNGGFLTDSLVTKPPTAGDSQSQSASNTSTSTTNSTTNPTNQPPQVNAAVLARPSDRPVTPPSGFAPPVPNQDPSAQQSVNAPLPPITILPQVTLGQRGPGALPPITLQPGDNPFAQSGLPPITLTPTPTAAGQQVPGQIPGQIPGQNRIQVPGQAQPTTPGQPPFPVSLPGQPVPGGIPQGVGGLPPGFQIDGNGQLVPINPVPGQSVPGQPQGFPGQPQGFPGQTPGIPGLPQPASQSGAPSGPPSGAIAAINQILQTPSQPTTTPLVTSGNQVGAIAGVASTHQGPSIKIYKDQTQYQLWEFVFSPTANTTPGAAAPGVTTGAPPSTGATQSLFGNSFSNGQSTGGQSTSGTVTTPSQQIP